MCFFAGWPVTFQDPSTIAIYCNWNCQIIFNLQPGNLIFGQCNAHEGGNLGHTPCYSPRSKIAYGVPAAAKFSVNDLDGEHSSVLQIKQSNSIKQELNLKSETNWQFSDTMMHIRVETWATAAECLVASAQYKNCT